jgi:hypothetical protein
MKAVITKNKISGFYLSIYEGHRDKVNLFISNYEKYPLENSDKNVRLAIYCNGIYSGSVYPDELKEEV